MIQQTEVTIGEPDLKAVWLLNGLCEGQLVVADVSQEFLLMATVFGIETYKIIKSSLGPEGYTATTDTNKMPRRS